MVDDSECRRLVPAFVHWSEEVAVPPIEQEGRQEHQMVKGFISGRGERNVSVGHSRRSSGGLFMVRLQLPTSRGRRKVALDLIWPTR
jgi:hypothetical protein